MLKRITDSQITIQQLEAEINSAEENSTVYLETNLTFDLREDRRFMVGNHVKRAIVAIERRDIIFDGQGNKIVFRLHQPPINDGVLFQIGQKPWERKSEILRSILFTADKILPDR